MALADRAVRSPSLSASSADSGRVRTYAHWYNMLALPLLRGRVAEPTGEEPPGYALAPARAALRDAASAAGRRAAAHRRADPGTDRRRARRGQVGRPLAPPQQPGQPSSPCPTESG